MSSSSITLHIFRKRKSKILFYQILLYFGKPPPIFSFPSFLFSSYSFHLFPTPTLEKIQKICSRLGPFRSISPLFISSFSWPNFGPVHLPLFSVVLFFLANVMAVRPTPSLATSPVDVMDGHPVPPFPIYHVPGQALGLLFFSPLAAPSFPSSLSLPPSPPPKLATECRRRTRRHGRP